MVAVRLPLNVKVRLVAAPVAAPPLLRARAPAPIVTVAPENAFARRTRTWRPATVLRTIIRTVWLLTDGRTTGTGNRRPGNGAALVPGGGTPDGAAGGVAVLRPGPVATPPARSRVCDVAHVATQCSPGARCAAAGERTCSAPTPGATIRKTARRATKRFTGVANVPRPPCPGATAARRAAG